MTRPKAHCWMDSGSPQPDKLLRAPPVLKPMDLAYLMKHLQSWECNSLAIHLKQDVQYPLPHSSQSIYFLTYYYRPGSSFAISAHLFPSLLCAW